ncbi:MAG: Glu-tRNA(Gln) amidotransferase GatDE subunit E [Methanobacteriota archaeon]|nr:MAG: Glu-tRNA(Gln) amidotransferase GatDE subunit E [Euryarchaeota archaeon]HIE63280.1 Glu-tRNA(Gln) amidotransferase subunit GatE [Candidatus Poseidoniales archaeon]HIK99952.1 Glu-tRNA(Gln) amidotransferase subunit GatE [Candidatus Poseidoniales archaeon]
MSESLATSIRMEPVGDVFSSDSLNPQGLGFMCGLEIHQQLATGKLHSRMPSQLYDQGLEEIPREWTQSHRKLRASQGEGGRVDIAARFEARRNRSFVYVQPPNAGLIEIDEAPPLEHDKDAVNAVLTMSAMMDAKPVSSLQVMRKTVVDGSNTSGFQRTTLVATNGVISTNSGIVGIDVICLEEDSARKLDTKSTNTGEIVYYILDRLGMPLVEIATAPDVQTPDHAKEVAIALGTMLRDTRMVRRGLGSIRQDLNVSIACGDRVEIKGCQDLDWIPKIIRLEMARQLHFYRLANTLRLEAGLPVLPPDRRQDSTPVENRVSASAKSRLPITIQNMTSKFETCDSAMVKKSLESGAVVKGISLPGFANKLGTKELDNNGAQMPRLGREFASAAKLAGVAGIFHSDELPAYGISSIEVERVREALNLSEMDAFILCAAPDWQADLALESVVNRARMAYHRIPQEVRNVVIRKGSPEDGTTTAMRPLPGGARMYPETDVPVLRIEGDYWNTISENLPMNRSERFTRLEKFKISSNQIEALLGSELDDIFVIGVEGGLHDCPSLPAKAWASILLDNTRSDIAKAVNIVEKAVDWPILTLTVHAREEGIITREGLIPMAALLITEGPTLGEAEFETRLSWFANRAEKEGFTPADTSAVEDAVDAILAERADFVAERGMEAVGPLMGMVMGKLGGAADGKIVSQVLREKIQKLT